MFKKILIGAFAALAFSVIHPISTMAAETSVNVSIDKSGRVTLMSDHAANDGITTLELSLKVETEVEADISFEFDSENDFKVLEYRYNPNSNQLNIYMSDSQSLFDSSNSLNIGAVSAKDTAGNDVSVTINEVEDSLKYVYNNTVVNVDVEFHIEPPATTEEPETTTIPETTTMPETTTTAATTTPATTTTTSTTTAETTTTAVETTTTPETTTVATTAPEKNPIASDEDFCDWSKKYYSNKNGIMPDKAEITKTADGMYKITLTDSSDNVLDVYVIDPETGIGTDSNGKRVNLPQTGNNSMKNVLIAVGSCMMIVFGFFALRSSGIIRRKKNEQ